MSVPRYPDRHWLAGLVTGSWRIVGEEFHCSADVLETLAAYNGTLPTSPSAGRVYRRDSNANRRRALAYHLGVDSAMRAAPENWWVYVVRDETAQEAAEDRETNPRRRGEDVEKRWQIHERFWWVECAAPCEHVPPVPPIMWRAEEHAEGMTR